MWHAAESSGTTAYARRITSTTITGYSMGVLNGKVAFIPPAALGQDWRQMSEDDAQANREAVGKGADATISGTRVFSAFHMDRFPSEIESGGRRNGSG